MSRSTVSLCVRSERSGRGSGVLLVIVLLRSSRCCSSASRRALGDAGLTEVQAARRMCGLVTCSVNVVLERRLQCEVGAEVRGGSRGAGRVSPVSSSVLRLERMWGQPWLIVSSTALPGSNSSCTTVS